MAAEQDRLVSSVPPSACSDDHLKKLGLKLSDWRVVAMLLGLEDSEIEDIQEKGKSTAERSITMLRRWRQSRGEQATYRCLASVFRDINRIDLVEKICELVPVLPTSPAPALVPNQSNTTLQSYTNHLKSLYQAHRPAAIVQALPPPTDKYFNLALIRKQRAEPPPDDEVVRSVVQEGNVDQVLKRKVGIQLGDIFEADEAARKVILIEGAPGSGKTTLSWHICQKWASGGLFQQFSLAVLVQLRDPAIQSARTIADLLPHADDRLAQEVMSEIQCRGGEGILFVMDGWDEMVLDVGQESPIEQLVQRNCLPKNTVIVTCRSESSGQLQEVASSRIETMGFTPSDVKAYFSECLKGDTQAVEKLNEVVQQNPQIEASSYLPLVAAIIVAIFLMTPTNKLPTILHDLFTTLVLTCILHHLQARTEYKAILSLTSLDDLPCEVQLSFDHLCRLAFDGLKRNKLSFSDDELGEHSNLSLLHGVQSFAFCGLGVGVSKTYSFLHLSVQELLAARYISKLSLDEQIQLFHELIDHPRYTAVFRFFAGITQLKSERIATFFQKIGKSGECDLSTLEQDIPLDVLQERYQYMYLTQPSPEWDCSELLQLCHVDMRLLLFNCLYEARNPSLYQSLAKVAGISCRNPPLLHFSETSMNAFDCLSLGYFLSWVCRTVSSETSIHLYEINDSCIQFLVKGLTEGIREAKSCGGGSLGTLFIELNNFTWEHDDMHYLTQLLQSSEGNCISGLELADSQLTDKDFLCLTEAVETSKSLRILNLRDISCALTTACRALGTMLQRNTTLRTFSIADHLITEIITDIAEDLKHNSTLETIRFEGFFGSMGLKLLAEIISYNKQLKTVHVVDKSRSSDGAGYLIEALKHNSTLQCFSLRGICLTVPQLEQLATVLTINTTLEELEYESESLSKAERTALTQSLLASGVLHQLLIIALERTTEWFGEQEAMKSFATLLHVLDWDSC